MLFLIELILTPLILIIFAITQIIRYSKRKQMERQAKEAEFARMETRRIQEEAKRIQEEERKIQKERASECYIEMLNQMVRDFNQLSEVTQRDNRDVDSLFDEYYSLLSMETPVDGFWDCYQAAREFIMSERGRVINECEIFTLNDREILYDFIENRFRLEQYDYLKQMRIREIERFRAPIFELVKTMINTMNTIILMCNDCIMYEYGVMWERESSDVCAPIPWWRKASEHGNSDAQNALAVRYLNNSGVEYRDYDKAFELLCASARGGKNGNAFANLGYCYEKGYGTKVNYQKAGDCYQKAIELGANCRDELDNLYRVLKWDRKKYSPETILSTTSYFSFDSDFYQYVKENKKLFDENILLNKYEDALGKAYNILESLSNKYIEFYCPEEHDCSLAEKIRILDNKGVIEKDVSNAMHILRKLRNRGIHNNEGEKVTFSEMQMAQSMMDVLINHVEKSFDTTTQAI